LKGDGTVLPADNVVTQLDVLLSEIEPMIHLRDNGTPWIHDEQKARQARTRVLAAVDRLTPSGSSYRRDASAVDGQSGYDGYIAPKLAGILRALREDYAAGYMQTIENLIHANLFADFLEMADELVGKGYKDAAAVIAGSTLEEHLRKLAVRSGVDAETPDGKPRKADTINADLVKAESYGKLDQKSVTAWLGLRNDAAHGHYENYDRAQVEALIRDVRSFMQRHPA
jgi:hypothetical protein